MAFFNTSINFRSTKDMRGIGNEKFLWKLLAILMEIKTIS